MAKLQFVITGEYLTRIARDMWCSDLIGKAIKTLTDGIGMSEEQAILVLTGKYKLIGASNEGDGCLDMVPDSVDYGKIFGMDVSIAGMCKRAEDNYTELFVRITALKRTRSLYIGAPSKDNRDVQIRTGLATATAGRWRKGNFTTDFNWDGTIDTTDNNTTVINDLEDELEEATAGLEVLFKLGKKSVVKFITGLTDKFYDLESMSHLELKEVSQWAITAERINDFKTNNTNDKSVGRSIVSNVLVDEKTTKQLELEKENARNTYIITVTDSNAKVNKYHTAIKDIVEMGDKEMELYREAELAYRTASMYWNKLSLSKGLKSPLTPMNPFVNPETTTTEHAFILPDGRFYEVGFQQHHYLEDNLLECKQVNICNEARHSGYGSVEWMDLGWIKISSREVLYGYMKDFTKSKDDDSYYVARPDIQIETLTRYLLTRDWEIFRTNRSKYVDPMEIVKRVKEKM